MLDVQAHIGNFMKRTCVACLSAQPQFVFSTRRHGMVSGRLASIHVGGSELNVQSEHSSAAATKLPGAASRWFWSLQERGKLLSKVRGSARAGGIQSKATDRICRRHGIAAGFKQPAGAMHVLNKAKSDWHHPSVTPHCGLRRLHGQSLPSLRGKLEPKLLSGVTRTSAPDKIVRQSAA
jgi:hypothetical protein